MDKKRKKYLKIFRAEADEHLLTLNNGLLALESGEANEETIHGIFRSAHTLKGSARMLGLEDIGSIAHKMEDILKEVENGNIKPTSGVIDNLLAGTDSISKLLEGEDAEAHVDCDSVLSCLAEVMKKGGAGADQKTGEEEKPVEAEEEKTEAEEPGPSQQKSQPVSEEGQTEDEPAEQRAEEIKPSEIKPAEKGKTKDAASHKTADTLRVDTERLDRLIDVAGELLISKSKIESKTFGAKNLLDELNEFLINFDNLSMNGDKEDARKKLQSMRRTLHDFVQEFSEDVIEMDVNVQEMQEGALKLRMTPASTLFEEFPRMVRDIARDLGKDIRLDVRGEDTELDKRLLEQLRGPLVHLIRNACDHGIETPEEREKNGKPRQGTVHLQAYHHGGTVIIEIADNGRGMNAPKIKEVALSRGIIDERTANELTEEETYYLTLLPGFSTSSLITDLSGRGVGLDVVKTNVELLRGDMSIKSVPGQGTKIELKLPLTVSIIEALLVYQGGELYAIPLTAVDGVHRVRVGDMVRERGRETLPVHGKLLPLVKLEDLLGLSPLSGHEIRIRSEEDQIQVVVLQFRNQKLALVVDRLMREQEILVKSLGSHLTRTPFVSGATILRKGEPALILNIFDIFSESDRAQGKLIRELVAQTDVEKRTARVMVVDDSITTRTIEKNILERAGYEVTTAVSAENAIEQLDQAPEAFDIFVVDVDMPGKNGFQLTEIIRGRSDTQEVPVIICTSRATDEDKRMGIQVGAQAYIVKGSFDQNVLLETVKSLIGE